MSESVRTQKIARLLQKALGEILLQEGTRLLGHGFVTVTEVRVSPDLSLAKVYLSFVLDDAETDLLQKVMQKKGEIKRQLGHRVGKKIRRIPDLSFYADRSVAHAARMDQLFAELNMSYDDKRST